MTMFAGIFSRHEDQPLPESVCHGLRRVISRDLKDEVRTFRDHRCFFAKVDIGAFGDSTFRVDESDSVSVIAGDPLLGLGGNDARQSRANELDRLHTSWNQYDWQLLNRARGVFCAAHYQPNTGKLFLISDKLSIRPLYYWADENFVIFATALRVLESLDAIPKSMDLRGVTELAGLGYPLGIRTPYSEISLLQAAEILQIEEKSISRLRYWHWDEIEPSRLSEAELLRDTHAAFVQAVSLRNGENKTTIAYLSGGLDSRCAVAALLELGAQVHTFNFALPGTQDYVFGNEFAARAGTIHEAVPKEHGDLTPDYSTLMARALGRSTLRSEQRAERSSLVWSGEGGSVAFGHVHLSPEVVAWMRKGETDKAIDTFLRQEHASVTRRLLRSKISNELTPALHAGIREELDEQNCADPGRSFYLFLMLNDQRRKLAAHFESIDLHRLEFQLPFFDSEFLARVVSLPVDLCLRHGLYAKWLKLFSPVVTEVPWQAYPGHEPCPVRVQQGAAYQWDSAYQAEQGSSLKRELLKQAAEMLGAPDFPKKILRKQYLRIAMLSYQSGLRDYSYVIESAWKYYTYWNICNGRYSPLSTGRNHSSSLSDLRDHEFSSETELTSSIVE